VAKHDQRRQYLTGFSGPSGLAVVTHRQAALWTGSRYFQQVGSLFGSTRSESLINPVNHVGF